MFLRETNVYFRMGFSESNWGEERQRKGLCLLSVVELEVCQTLWVHQLLGPSCPKGDVVERIMAPSEMHMSCVISYGKEKINL